MSGAVPPDSPPATRLRRPSWLDLRLVGGVLLVLVAVLVGGRVLASADQAVQVWAVQADLAAGTTLGAGDLRTVRVQLYDSAASYLAVAASPVGRTLLRALSAGDLLPRSALGETPAGSLVSIPVSPQHVPGSLRAGQRIDVYATAKPAAGAVAKTARVLAGVTVQQVRVPDAGVLSSTAQVAVVVRIDDSAAMSLVAAMRTADLDIAIAPPDRRGPVSTAALPVPVPPTPEQPDYASPEPIDSASASVSPSPRESR
ncbi:SAF domain-containing protein [Fodinicola feengrottensis]|uniref:SAF domain-containing protein n=2 Tax=Fodinicola feengrottensis TaxID=435914 RepID=A0ABP4TDX0_9ACTN|nr:SAF domain-containing protein [Fodinicola feengrottensis]